MSLEFDIDLLAPLLRIFLRRELHNQYDRLKQILEA